MIEFRGSIDRPLYVKALRLHGTAPPALGQLLIGGGILNLLVNGRISNPATWAASLFLGLFGAFLLLSPILLARQALRTSTILREGFTGYADAEQFVLESSHGRSNVRWSSFYRAAVSSNIVLLYTSAQQFYILARSFFASDGDWAEFKTLVTQRLPLRNTGRTVWKAALLWFMIVVGTFFVWSLVNSFAR